MIYGILHHGVTVSDLDAAIDWYTKALGLVVVHRQRQENDYTPLLVGVPGAVLEVAQLAIEGGSGTRSTHDIELIQYVSEGAEGAPSDVNRVGSAHLAFLVKDIDRVVERVVRAGGKLRNAPVGITAGANKGGRACYLHDPDGNTLELMQRPTAGEVP